MKLDKYIKKVLETLDELFKEMYPEYLTYEDTILNRGKSSMLAIEMNIIEVDDKMFEVLFVNDDLYLIDVYKIEDMLEGKLLRAEKMEAESGNVVKKQVNITEYLLSKINKIRNATTNGD